MNAAQIAGLVTAVTALVTAVTALIRVFVHTHKNGAAK